MKTVKNMALIGLDIKRVTPSFFYHVFDIAHWYHSTPPHGHG